MPNQALLSRPWEIKLHPSRTLILRGPEGCGKTTLAREIAAAHGRFFEVQAEYLSPYMFCAHSGFFQEWPTCIVDIESIERDMPRVKSIITQQITVQARGEPARLVRRPNIILCWQDHQPLSAWIDDRRWHTPLINWADYPAEDIAKQQAARLSGDGEMLVSPVEHYSSAH